MFAVEKQDIKDTYGDPMMPMKLRMLAEGIYGRALGGEGDNFSDDDYETDDEDF